MTRRIRTLLTALAVAALALPMSACAPGADVPPDTGSTGLSGSIQVFAAASLKDVFTDLGQQFESKHPGTTVQFNFAGSSSLAAQIIEGAPADVFASADEANMSKVIGTSMTQSNPKIFATNTLTIVVPPSDPAGITSFADLAKPGVKVVICAAPVPCGAATERAEEATGVTLSPVSEEQSVTDVLGKVISGEADAGLVYVTDAAGAKDQVKAISFEGSDQTLNRYPIGQLDDSENPAVAAAFIDFVLGPDGQKALQNAGFGTESSPSPSSSSPPARPTISAP